MTYMVDMAYYIFTLVLFISYVLLVSFMYGLSLSTLYKILCRNKTCYVLKGNE